MIDDPQAVSRAALEGRIRRRKRRLERMNPVEDFAAYEERLVELVALQAELRGRVDDDRRDNPAR